MLYRIVFMIALYLPFQLVGQSDSALIQVFEPPALGTVTGHSVSFSQEFVNSGSTWALSFPESDVHLARITTNSPLNPEKEYELRIGKGGQIYSLIGGFGESVPPQWRHPNWVEPSFGGGTSYAPWVDEVWQMVAVDEALNNVPDSSYFIHQSGVYLKTPSQISPFYSPAVAQWYNEDEQSFTVVNWGQQAHTEDLENIYFSSRLLYYSKYTFSYPGVIQVDQMIYNFGDDNMSFVNVPWGGVRHSSLGHTFLSAPDHSFQEIVGMYGATPVIQANQTGGWLAWSNDSLGNSSALAVANTTGTVTNNNVIRYGDAGNLAAAWNDRDYSVLEMIRRPNASQLTFGTSLTFRYFYVIDASVQEISNVIQDLALEAQAFDSDAIPTYQEVDSIGYRFVKNGDQLVVAERSSDLDALYLRQRPYLDSYPIFEMVSDDSTTVISSNPNHFSTSPWDGQTTQWKLLGFHSNPMVSMIDTLGHCANDSLELTTGEIVYLSSDTVLTSLVHDQQYEVDSLIITLVELQSANTYYLDADGDGFGDDQQVIVDCDMPIGAVLIAGDCDDSNNSVYPGAAGTHQGFDNNCDGVIGPQEASCTGDLDNDQDVDIADLLSLLSWAGCTGQDCLADFNEDGSTTTIDLLLLISNFGNFCQ